MFLIFYQQHSHGIGLLLWVYPKKIFPVTKNKIETKIAINVGTQPLIV